MKVADITVDANIVNNICTMTLLISYPFMMGPVDKQLLAEGAISSVFSSTANMLAMLAISMGPGGPVNALASTKIVLQSWISAVFFGQTMSMLQIVCVCVCLLAATFIAVGDD